MLFIVGRGWRIGREGSGKEMWGLLNHFLKLFYTSLSACIEAPVCCNKDACLNETLQEFDRVTDKRSNFCQNMIFLKERKCILMQI